MLAAFLPPGYQYSLLPQHLPGLGLEHHSCRPRHRHQFALCLFPLNHFDFVFRRGFRNEVIHPASEAITEAVIGYPQSA